MSQSSSQKSRSSIATLYRCATGYAAATEQYSFRERIVTIFSSTYQHIPYGTLRWSFDTSATCQFSFMVLDIFLKIFERLNFSALYNNSRMFLCLCVKFLWQFETRLEAVHDRVWLVLCFFACLGLLL